MKRAHRRLAIDSFSPLFVFRPPLSRAGRKDMRPTRAAFARRFRFSARALHCRRSAGRKPYGTSVDGRHCRATFFSARIGHMFSQRRRGDMADGGWRRADLFSGRHRCCFQASACAARAIWASAAHATSTAAASLPPQCSPPRFARLRALMGW